MWRLQSAVLRTSQCGHFDREGVVPLCRYALVLARRASYRIVQNC
jgi:hypothetical protein